MADRRSPLVSDPDPTSGTPQHRITGCHNLWVNEYTIRYDDQP